ncbi:MAG: hypothetical protein AB1540_17210 [Bdellovibrionota bacterium]
MSLNLHTECKQRLSEKIAEYLPQVKVQNRVFLERKSTGVLLLVEPILPQSGMIKVQLEQYVSEAPIYNFIYETLSTELYESQEYDSAFPSTSLAELEGYHDPKAVAQKLVEGFESLPWEYSLTIKLENDFGELFAKTIKNYSICDSMKLINPNDEFIREFPLQSGIKARDRSLAGGLGLLGLSPQKWNQSATYFQIRVIGFIGRYGDTAPLEEAISLLKAFCGIGIAVRLFKVNYTYRTLPTKAEFFVHRRVSNAWSIERIRELDAVVSDTFHDLVFHDLDGSLDSEAKKSSWMQNALGSISCVFMNQEKARRLILASQWFFDSFCGKNELLSFVQTAVVMEILLGEKAVSDLTGLGELLRNRCAYLIGKSREQREGILKDFKEIYDVRSKIVHSGKSRLNLYERTLFSKLQWMCRRVIQEEVKLLQEDLKSA